MMPPSNNLSALSRCARSTHWTRDFRPWTLDFGLWTSLLLAVSAMAATTEPAPPDTPREFYNAGTRQLAARKLREAEASLESALASQKEQLRPPALYNLGLVRFGQGVEQLKKGPAAKPTIDRGQSAAQQAEIAARQANEALGGNDLDKMVAAYLRGRGARKELKAATEAVHVGRDHLIQVV